MSELPPLNLLLVDDSPESLRVLQAMHERAVELRVNRANLDAALASMTDAVSISDAAGQLLEFNDAFASFHRFKNKTECVRWFADYPQLLEVFLSGDKLVPLDQWAMPRALRGETVTNAEFTLRRKDTGESWVGSYSFNPIRDKEGVIVGSVVVARDITELKQMEQESRATKYFLEVIVASSPMPIIAHDPQGNITQWNPAAEQLLGWSATAVVGQPPPMIPPERQPQFRETLSRVLKEDRLFLKEVPMVCQDGSRLYCDLAIGLLRGAASEIRGMVAIIGDVSQRKEAEDALRQLNIELEQRVQERTAALHESEARFRIAAETANDVVYEWDLKQSIQWLGNIDELLGFGPSEFPRTLEAWVARVHPEDQARVMAAVHAHLDGGAPYTIEYRIRRKDGVYRWWAARGTALRTPEGKSPRWIGSITDITERKESEVALRETNEALKLRMAEIEIFNHAMVGREQRIIAMKEEVNALCKELGREPEYPPVWREGGVGNPEMGNR